MRRVNVKAKKIVSILFVLFFAVAAVQAETSALTPQPADSTPAVQTESEVKEPEEVKIKASEGISGDKSAVNLSGDVIIEGTDFIARGSEAEVDLVEGIVRFTGGVTVDQKDRQFVGEELVYNYKTKAGTIVGVSGNIENEKLKGDLYIYGQEMRLKTITSILQGGKSPPAIWAIPTTTSPQRRSRSIRTIGWCCATFSTKKGTCPFCTFLTIPSP